MNIQQSGEYWIEHLKTVDDTITARVAIRKRMDLHKAETEDQDALPAHRIDIVMLCCVVGLIGIEVLRWFVDVCTGTNLPI